MTTETGKKCRSYDDYIKESAFEFSYQLKIVSVISFNFHLMGCLNISGTDYRLVKISSKDHGYH